MKFELVKERLHDYIENSSQAKIEALYLLLNEEIENRHVTYDEATLNILEARRDDMINGKGKKYTLEQTIENLHNYRKGYGL